MALGEGYTTHDVAWLDVKGGGRILPLPNVVYRISKPLPNGMVYLRKIKSAPDVPFHCNLCWIMFIRTSSKTIRNNSIYGTKSSVTNGTGSPSPVSKFRLSTNWPPIIKLTPKR